MLGGSSDDSRGHVQEGQLTTRCRSLLMASIGHRVYDE